MMTKLEILCQVKHRNIGRATILFDIIDLIIIFRILVINKICHSMVFSSKEDAVYDRKGCWAWIAL